MSETIEHIPLPFGDPGTERALAVHRFGRPGARPKVYIQAGLHADETPGLLVARHVLDRLRVLADRVAGEIIVVPVANPIGLGQTLMGTLIGRFDFPGGVNFNRAFLKLDEACAPALEGALGDDAAANVARVRAAMRDAIADWQVTTQADAQRRALLGLAADADIVLDLHCDKDAVLHLYTAPELWDRVSDLSARLGCAAAFLEENSGGEPFDEACSAPWPALRRRFGLTAETLPAACVAVTVELRGFSDVEDDMAAADAGAIIDHLAAMGAIQGDAPPAPPARTEPTPLAGVDRVRAPASGVVLYAARLGDHVRAGEAVAHVLDPVTGRRHPCLAAVDGPVWVRNQHRFVRAGDQVMAVAGAEPIPNRRGSLLSSR